MLLLLIAGLLGNTFSEKAKVMIFSALADANYMFQKTDLVVLFWLGVSMFIIWLAMLFLFGMSLFLEISQGKNRVEHWIPFNLNFGCSYFLWMLLILLVAGVPGTWLLVTLAYFFPEIRSFMPSLLPALNILVFPIVFLCVIESETFLGPFPRKTLTSLLRLPRLWLRFYATTFFLVVVPLIVLFLWTYAGMGKRDLWESQTVMYVFSGMIWTACGFFVLLYFLRLGLLAWEIEQEYETAA